LTVSKKGRIYTKGAPFQCGATDVFKDAVTLNCTPQDSPLQ